MRIAHAIALVVGVATSGCGRPTKPFETRLAALERGEPVASVFGDLLDVPYVRDSLRTVDDARLPKRYQPIAGKFARLVSPRGQTLDATPRFTWLLPDVPASAYQLTIWEGTEAGPGSSLAIERVEGSSCVSPIALEPGKAYFWAVLDADRGAGAQLPFVVAEADLADRIRDAAESLERALSDRPTSLLLQTNLFEYREYFGEASVRLLELWRLYPNSTYLEKRAHRFSLYLVSP